MTNDTELKFEKNVLNLTIKIKLIVHFRIILCIRQIS